MQLDEKNRLDVFSCASQTPRLDPVFCLYRGDLTLQGGCFYYREGVNSTCSGPPKEGSRHCMALARAIILFNITEGLPRREDRAQLKFRLRKELPFLL